MREIDENSLETALEGQLPEVGNPVAESAVEPAEEAVQTEASQYLGQKLTHKIGRVEVDKEKDAELVTSKRLSRVGEKIQESVDYRDGWIDVDKRLLGDRAIFYPEEWQFRIKPATVEAIRNWSTIDNENPNSIDDVFNEILKTCLAIVTPQGPLPWGNIRSWDRFFFILLIREYTFQQGEKKVEYSEDCPNCDNPVTFELNSGALMYELPDKEIMKYFSAEEQNWFIDPNEYGVDWPEPVTLYLPTLEKDANIKAWMIDRIQQKKKIDQVFIKFLTWLAPKISKDLTIAQRQIRDYEVKFKSWDTDMFSFMNEVVTNIAVVPSTKLMTTCPTCGEEVTSDIRFPNGVSDLFNISSGRKKFGKK